MSDPTRLYSAGEIANMLGVTRHWVVDRIGVRGTPAPTFYVDRGGSGTQQLWTEQAVDHWRAYYASGDSLPDRAPGSTYSDHRCINQIASTRITWKLWWKLTSEGPEWWLSTPHSWWMSPDDGVSWTDTGQRTRPNGYRYRSVIGIVTPGGATAGVLRSAADLRRRLEAS